MAPPRDPSETRPDDRGRGDGLVRPSPGRRADRACLALCGLLFALGAAIHLSVQSYPDTARFKGDTWDYQSLAVNLARGHGFRFGGVEPFEAYRFERRDPWPRDRARFERAGARRDGPLYFHSRTPGYPMFLAAIYTAAGIRPAVAKHVQALLLILVAAWLPFLGLRWWGPAGVVGGLLAIPPFLWHMLPQAAFVMTESLITFTLFLIVLAHVGWAHRESRGRLFVLGLAVGLGLLVKGSLAFLPALYVGYLVWRYRGSGGPALARHLAVFLGGALVLVLPYSAFASLRSGQLVLVSTQGQTALLDGNNEYAARSGDYEARWRLMPDSFFYRPDVRDLPAALQVARFYQERPGDLARILPRKLGLAFGQFAYLKPVCLVLAGVALLSLLAETPAVRGQPRGAVVAALLLTAVLGAWIHLAGIGGSRLLAVTAAIVLPVVALRPRFRTRLPAPVVIVSGNFVLVTLALFGERRVTLPMGFLVILTTAALGVWGATEAGRALAPAPPALRQPIP